MATKPKHIERGPNDQPIGVKIALEEGYDRSKPQPMTDELGRFVSANRNPVPTPNTYRQGLNQPIDTRTGEPLPETRSRNFSYERDVGDAQPKETSMQNDPMKKDKAKQDKAKGQATIKTELPPGERPESANS